MTQVNGTVKSSKSETLEGVVAAVNEHGLRLRGQEGWLNFSKFSPVQPPEVGQTVRLQVSGGRWIRGLEVLSEPQTEPPQETGTPQTPDRLALRKYALSLAVRVYTTDAGSTWASAENIVAMASAFEDWLTR